MSRELTKHDRISVALVFIGFCCVIAAIGSTFGLVAALGVFGVCAMILGLFALR